MNFEKMIDIFKIEDYLNNNYVFYAHEEKGRKETLKEHIELCKKYFKLIVKEKNVEKILSNMEREFWSTCSDNTKSFFKEMIINIVIFHDIGKVNIAFQRYKMNNNNFKGLERYRETDHSMYSSILYIDWFLEKILNLKLSENEQEITIAFLFLNSYVISRHHSGLNNFNEYYEKTREVLSLEKRKDYLEPIETFYNKKIILTDRHIETINKYLEEFKKNNELHEIGLKNIGSLYVYERFLLSLLVASDYYATSEFFSGVKVTNLGVIRDISNFYESYKKSKIYKEIRKYEKTFNEENQNLDNEKDINILRNELFLEAEYVLNKNYQQNIFYLEAPTGSGKSNVANNLAFKLLEMDRSKTKIVYVYPFNTLVEQNINSIAKLYEDKLDVMESIAVINSLYPIKEKNESDDCDENYEKALLNREFLNYPMILTTHVSLFNYFFGTNKEDIFPVHQFANSVIIFDEIQSYKNKIWREIIEFFNVYSELLNIKIIIMSATLPNLDTLIKSDIKSIKLIKDREKYFSNSLFKHRVKLDYSLLKKSFSSDILVEKIKRHRGRKILIEFIRKASAYEFFEYLNSLKEELELKEILLITGDDNLAERKEIINKVKESKDLILIATQVIEAGVDIDMDIGMKDISIFDSEEQFLGRVNRSCLKKDCKVYFFNKDDASNIYKEDVRSQKQLSLVNEEMRILLNNKEFYKYYEIVSNKLMDITNKENKLNTEKFFRNEVKNLEFKEISEKMKLIDDLKNDITIFLNRKIKVNDEILIGEEVWDNYKKLLMDTKLKYAEKKIRLSKVNSKMNYFLYRIKTNQNLSYSDRIGEILYIDDGEQYFKDGKLDKSKFESNVGEFI